MVHMLFWNFLIYDFGCFPSQACVLSTSCSQPPWRRLKRTQQTKKKQLNLVKLVLATPLKTKVCMIMLLVVIVCYSVVWLSLGRSGEPIKYWGERSKTRSEPLVIGHVPLVWQLLNEFLDYCIAVYIGLQDAPNNAQQGGVRVTIVLCPPAAPSLVSRNTHTGRIATAFGLAKLNFDKRTTDPRDPRPKSRVCDRNA